MIDFTLTNNGDIALEPAVQYPVCRFDFFIKKYPCLRLDFDTDIKRYNVEPYGLKLKINTDLHTTTTIKKMVPPITEQAEVVQEIKIRLKTELGEYKALPNLGSWLALERHKNLRLSTVQEQVQQYTEQAISDVEFDQEPTVTVTHAADDKTRFRHETLKITIDTGNITYFEDTL